MAHWPNPLSISREAIGRYMPVAFISVLILALSALSGVMSPAQGQEEDRVDVKPMLANLIGEWSGTLLLEDADNSPQRFPYSLDVEGALSDMVLIERHEIEFANGIAETLEILTFDESAYSLHSTLITRNKRFNLAFPITSAQMTGNEKSWKILSEFDEKQENTTVQTRILFQLNEDSFTKYRWQKSKDSDGYQLTDTLTLERVKTQSKDISAH